MRLWIIVIVGALAACSAPSDENAGEAVNVESANQSPDNKAAEQVTASTIHAPPRGMERNCQYVACEAGVAAVIKQEKGDETYACATEAVAEYVSFVEGLLSMSKSMGGKTPNISPATGEPEYEGDTKAALDALRGKAGVSTFDEAFSKCAVPPNRTRVSVLNYPAASDRNFMWVTTHENRNAFWVLKSSAELLP